MTEPLLAGGIDRRQFLARAGVLGLATALWQVPPLLRLRGWDSPVYAQEANLVRDTINGLVAFIFPGNDEYSVAQGDSTDGPGAIAADTTTIFIQSLDEFLPAPDGPGPGTNDETVPLSPAIANLLNVVAATVNPAAAAGPFPSHFSRLTAEEKAEVFKVLETDNGIPDAGLPEPLTATTGNFRFVAGIIPGFVAFLALGEWHTYDPDTRTLNKRPVGWNHSGYQGNRTNPVEGWDEFLGYYQGRRSVSG
jgi:hypothetical protein